MAITFGFGKRCATCKIKLPKNWSSIYCSACEPKIDPSETLEDNVATEFLPLEYFEDIIRDMKEGVIYYTVPWAMFADSSCRLFINGKYSYHKKPGGTVQLRVMKRDGEYFVEKRSIGTYRYQPGQPTFLGSDESDFIPIKLVGRF